MADEPNNTIDQPRDLPEHVSQEQTAPAGDSPLTDAASTPASSPAPGDQEEVCAEVPLAPGAVQGPSDPSGVDSQGQAPASEPATGPSEAEPGKTAAGRESIAYACSPVEPEIAADETAAAEPPVPEPPAAEALATDSSVVAAPIPSDPGVPAARPSRKKPAKGKSGKAKAAAPDAAVESEPEEPKSENMNWFILKVQSNREESIREGLLRRVAIAGYGRFFGDVIVPTEKVTEFKGGKKRVVKRKLYPGYLVVNMEINEDTWFLVRETPGIGDFTGASGHPTPMLPHEVARILVRQEEKSEKAPKLKIGCRPGDQVKINEGTFENFEGEVESIDETNGRVTVMINIFGRSTPVELEYWQIEAV